MRTKRFLIFIVILAVAGIVANVPSSLFFGQTADERRKEVISAFVNLTLDPAHGAIWGQDWMVYQSQMKGRRRDRLEHIHPSVLAAHAEALGMTPDALRERVIDPQQADPFEIGGAQFDVSQVAPDGEAGSWQWVVMQETAWQERQAAVEGGCGLWVVFWSKVDWYFAPIGTPALTAPLEAALPEMSALTLSYGSACAK